MNIQQKIVDAEALQKLLHHWWAVEDKVVFTNGCFDVLHVGHVSLLNQCAELGDRVIVGLNSDVSIRKIKGINRPIQEQADRAMILASLKNVDAVILFDEETPLELIKNILPDVLVKGGDYTTQNIVGAAEVAANGGTVKIIELVKGRSSTDIADRIAKL